MLLAQLVLFVLIIQVVVRPLMAAYLFTHPPRLRVTFRTPADWGSAYRDVQFTGSDGITLAGWYVPSRNGAAVVLLHGHSGNRLAVAFHAEALVRAGYGVLLFDLRAHGDSGGRKFSRGVAAVDDVLAAVAFMARQHDSRGRVGVMGVSVGGMLAIQAAARNVTIRAVVADGPILGTIDDLPPPTGVLDRLWRYPLERYYQAAIDWLSRSSRPPSNTAALARIARRPILLISAGRGLEQRLTRHFYDAAAEPRQLWEIPHATHATGWAVEPEAYARVMIDFFHHALSVEDAAELEKNPDATDAPAATVPPGIDSVPPSIHSELPEVVAEQYAPVEPRPIGERTVPPSTAMMIAFGTIPMAMILLLVPFQLRWGLFAPRLPEGRGLVILLGLFALLFAGLLLHEAVHLMGYRLIGHVPRGTARFNFGRVALAPQVHCATPVRAGAYRRILILPALLLGVLPGLIAIFIGSWPLLIWATWMLVAASGDFVALWAMRGVPSDAPVRAHPTHAGCLIFAKPESVDNGNE